MTDKRQALIDAIQAIQQAREVYGKKPGQLPPGQFDIEVDPELDEPQHNTTDDLLDQDVEVEDPDNVLKDQKQQKQQRQQKQRNQQKQNNSEDNSDEDDDFNDEDELDSESDEEDTNDESNDDQKESDKQGNKKKSNSQENEPSEEGEDSDPIPGEDKGEEQEDENEKLDPNYIKAWNEIMDRFDDDSISEDEVRRLLSDVKSGKIDSI